MARYVTARMNHQQVFEPLTKLSWSLASARSPSELLCPTQTFSFLRNERHFLFLGPQRLPDYWTVLTVVTMRIPSADAQLTGDMTMLHLGVQHRTWHLVPAQPIFRELNGIGPFLGAVMLVPRVGGWNREGEELSSPFPVGAAHPYLFGKVAPTFPFINSLSHPLYPPPPVLSLSPTHSPHQEYLYLSLTIFTEREIGISNDSLGKIQQTF